MKTQAAILFKTGDPLVIDDVEIPKLHNGQVLVKILASGVCRAQLNENIALKGPDKFLPHLLGHEASGLVVDIGPNVTKVKKNDYVVCSWIKGRGGDGISSKYHMGTITVNAGAITTFSRYSVISENRLTKISRRIPPKVAALLGCAIPTGVGILRNTLRAQKGSTIAITGVGGVGGSAILGAVLRQCKVIIAIDITETKLRWARSLGATHAINAGKTDHRRAIFDIVPAGVDYAIDASGSSLAMEAAFESLSQKGTLVIAGNVPKGGKIRIHPFDLIAGKQILGTWGGETQPDRDVPRYGQLYLRGQLPVEKLITRTGRLRDINTIFDAMKNNTLLGRAIIEFP